MIEARRRFATEVVRVLREAGFRALWAGGCVRDLILGHEPSDFDVATDATPEAVMGLFRRTVPVGLSFGVVRVLGPADAGEVEVATFRSDGAYLDGRRPESVRFGSPEEDAARRDFTINGMFLDPLDGSLLDHVGGRADLDRRLLRAIGDPAARFAEDKLRLLRALRFAARFDFAIEPATENALRAMASEVRVVAPERIAQELRKILVHPSRARALCLAMNTGLAPAILPALSSLRGRADPVRSIADLWDHTMAVLDALPDEPDFPLAFAALLHELDDPAARVEAIARELKLSNTERERVAWLVRSRDVLLRPEALSEVVLKRTMAQARVRDLIALTRAEERVTRGTATAAEFCERYLRDQPQGPIDPLPLLDGNDLRALGLRPGPDFSAWLTAVRDAQLGRRIGTKEEAVAFLERQVIGRPLR